MTQRGCLRFDGLAVMVVTELAQPGTHPLTRFAALLVGAFLTFTFVLGLLPREPGRFARLSLAGLLCAWIVPALPLLVFFHQRFGTRGLIALLVLSKFGDTCGYYVGNAIGKSHPFPKISPGKTTAGCVGLRPADMLEVLKSCDKSSTIEIKRQG